MSSVASASAVPRYDVAIPTAGRASLATLLAALAEQDGPAPARVIVVDDRGAVRGDDEPLTLGPAAEALGDRLELLRSGGRGPAAARNFGWRRARSEWVAFLDDDVVPTPRWATALAADLAPLGPEAVASQGRIEVPLPVSRPATDRERSVAGLETAVWATADMAYRRTALAALGGFDERFPRAYREDSDLALRAVAAGGRIVRGRRRTVHPVGPAGPLASVRAQAGNADDVMMAALHGRRWRERAGAPAGRRPAHLATTAAGVGALAALLGGRRRLATAAAAVWGAATADFAWRRIAPGPRDRREVAAMALTSVLIPPAATWHTARGIAGLPRRLRAGRPRPLPQAVLLDRDGTLVADVPYNGDPDAVRPLPGVPEALRRLRDAGIATAVVSNQSGIGRGLLTVERVAAVNRRVEELLGPLGPWLVCPHAPDAGCDCRKPAPGLVLAAARAVGAPPARCAVIGDIGADVEAARAAGARAILVPTAVTRGAEITAAPEVAPDLPAAVELLIGDGR